MTLLYIDPGTGAMLFSVATGLLSAMWFGARKLYLKLKYMRPGAAKRDTAKRDIVIYGEDKRYWTTFKGILDELERRGVDATYLAGSADDPLLSRHYEHIETKVIGTGNKAYARLNLLNARVCLATTPGLDVYQWKRSRGVDWYVHITHAIEAGTAYRMFGTQFFDAVLLCSDVFTPLHRELERKRGAARKEIVAVGQTYMDYLVERRNTHARQSHPRQTHPRQTLPQPLPVREGGDHSTPLPHREGAGEGLLSVLVAPSWGANSLLNKFGEALLDSLVATGFDITLRPHPQSFISDKELIERLQAKYPEGDHFHWNRDADNFDVLNASDIMISDFSGVIYDYVFAFERPVIYTAALPDTSAWDEAWLDGAYWGSKVLPKIGVELTADKVPTVGKMICDTVSDRRYAESIKAVRAKYWQNQGHAAQCVADYLTKKCEALKGAPTKELNI